MDKYFCKCYETKTEKYRMKKIKFIDLYAGLGAEGSKVELFWGGFGII